MKSLVRTVILLSAVLGALALLASAFVGRISPETIGALSFVQFSFIYLWFINFALIFLIVCRCHFWMLLITVPALVCTAGELVQSVQICPVTKSRDEIGQPVSLLSYNVRVFNAGRWLPGVGVRDYVDFVLSADRDIVCLQEFSASTSDPKSDVAAIVGMTSARYPYHKVDFTGWINPHQKSGQAVFSKYPIVASQSIRFEDTGNSVQRVDISVHGRTIRVLNCHLESIKLSDSELNAVVSAAGHPVESDKRELRHIGGKMSRAQQRRARQARAVHAEVGRSPYPVIVCGDFNDIANSYTCQTAFEGLDDAFVRSGCGIGNTYNGKLPPLRIDYICYDKSLKAYNYQRFLTELSDHYPIACDFDISETELNYTKK